jgi:RNA polymerase sigma factor (sigma-70 family)
MRVSNDDQQAYTEIYSFFYKRFYNYGKKFTEDESLIEDVVQETLLLIWDKRKALSSIEYIATYFYSSFRYALLGKLKQNKQMVLDEQVAEEPDFPIDHLIVIRESDDTIKKQLKNALAALTPRQREAIFLRFYEGLPYDEVALLLGITTKATYKIMARALLQLKEMVAFSTPIAIMLLKQYFSGK